MQLGVGPDGPIQGRRVAITGLGAVTCCGTGVDALWDGLLSPSVVGGPVTEFDPGRWFGPKEVRQIDRFAQFSVAAADMAVKDAGDIDADPDKSGVIYATGVGGLTTLADQVVVYHERGARRVSPRLVPMMMANAGAAGISMHLGWHGPSEVIVTACAAGSPRDRCRRTTRRVRTMRRHGQWRGRSRDAAGLDRRLHQHDRAVDLGTFAPL